MPRVLVSLALAVLTAVAAPPSSQAGPIDPFGKSGISLSEAAYAELKEAARKIYSDPSREPGDTEAWRDPNGPSQGTVTFIERHEYQGMPCIRLRHDIEFSDLKDRYRFVVSRCRVEDGTWKIL